MTSDELTDIAEIRRLMYRYASSVDTKDWSRLATVFTEDAHLDYSSVGFPPGARDDVIEMLAQALAVVPMTQHLVTNIEPRIDGDRATVRAVFFNPMSVPGSDAVMFCGGTYHHELVRTPDGWRSAALREETSWFAGHPDPTQNGVVGRPRATSRGERAGP